LAAIAHRNSNNNALYYSQQISPGTWQRDSLPLRDVVRLGVPLVLAFDSASVPYIAYNISSTTTAEVQILRKPHNDTTWRAVPIVENEGKIADRFQFFINGKRLTLAGVRTLEGAGGLAVLTANEWKAGTPSSRPLSSGTENLNKLSLYPNPIQDKFSLDFTLNEPDKLTIMLTEPTGRIVEQLFEASLPAGQHRFHFDAGNLAAGMYFCNIITSTKSKVIKTIKTP
jgi:hypothetical protein